MLVGNKSDLSDTQRQVTEGRSDIPHPAPYWQCCSLLGCGLALGLSATSQVTYEEAAKFAEDNGSNLYLFDCLHLFIVFGMRSGLVFIETSAKTGDNVEESFLRTARKIYDNIQSGCLGELNMSQY